MQMLKPFIAATTVSVSVLYEWHYPGRHHRDDPLCAQLADPTAMDLLDRFSTLPGAVKSTQLRL